MVRLTSSNFVAEILGTFHSMVKSGEHCDVTLRCHDGDVQVPGLILAAISPLFRALGVYLSTEMDVNILLPDFKVRSSPSKKRHSHNDIFF